MPITTKTLLGISLLAGLAAVAGPAQAGPITVLGADEGTRIVTLKIADLNLKSDADRARLGNRINSAARKVCGIGSNSALDQTPSAMTCVTHARTDAWSQADARLAAGSSAAVVVGMQ